jgi:hypothetical protein
MLEILNMKVALCRIISLAPRRRNVNCPVIGLLNTWPDEQSSCFLLPYERTLTLRHIQKLSFPSIVHSRYRRIRAGCQ